MNKEQATEIFNNKRSEAYQEYKKVQKPAHTIYEQKMRQYDEELNKNLEKTQ